MTSKSQGITCASCQVHHDIGIPHCLVANFPLSLALEQRITIGSIYQYTAKVTPTAGENDATRGCAHLAVVEIALNTACHHIIPLNYFIHERIHLSLTFH